MSDDTKDEGETICLRFEELSLSDGRKVAAAQAADKSWYFYFENDGRTTKIRLSEEALRAVWRLTMLRDWEVKTILRFKVALREMETEVNGKAKWVAVKPEELAADALAQTPDAS